MNTPKVLFIGGPGNISWTAAQSLIGRGVDLTILTLPDTDARGMDARFIRGSRDDSEFLSKVASEVKPDIVVDFVCFRPNQASASAAVFRDRVKQYVFISTVDIYGYPLSRLPMPVDGAIRPQLSVYAHDKYECEQIFSATAGLPLTIFRPAYSFGVPFVLSVFSRSGGKMMLSRLKAGRPIVVPGDGTTLIHAGAAANTGRMVARAIGNKKSVGKAYNGAHQYAMTHDEYVNLFAQALGVQPNIVHVPVELLVPHEMKLIPDNLLSELTRYSTVFSIAEFMADFQDFIYETTLEEAAAEYVRVHSSNGSIPEAVGNYEDTIAESWRHATAEFRL